MVAFSIAYQKQLSNKHKNTDSEQSRDLLSIFHVFFKNLTLKWELSDGIEGGFGYSILVLTKHLIVS
ncbi:hypothetical protein EBI01_18080 [Marinomonas rhizomae]|nr:hypothetical protein EBI01_18080 [Marinomonas rhizomae]